MTKTDVNYIFNLLEYYNARILHVAINLGIFDELDTRPLPAKTIAGKIDTDPRATELLLNALVALKLVMKRGKLYSNRTLAARHLVSGKEQYIGNIVMHGANNWQNWGNLEEAVQKGRQAKLAGAWRADTAKHRDFILAMHDLSKRKAKIIAEAIDFKGVFTLLDVGGGPGIYSIYFCKAHPSLTAYVYDYPETVAIATEVISRYRMRSRISCIPGDFMKNRLPGEYDMVWASNIIHSYSSAENKRLMKKLFRATKPGGKILIQDFVLNENRTAPFFAARFALNMLINTANGGTYTFSEISDWLKSAGFTKISRLKIRLPNEVQIIQARKGS